MIEEDADELKRTAIYAYTRVYIYIYMGLERA